MVFLHILHGKTKESVQVKFKNQGNEHFWYPVFHVPHDGWRFPPELLESGRMNSIRRRNL